MAKAEQGTTVETPKKGEVTLKQSADLFLTKGIIVIPTEVWDKTEKRMSSVNGCPRQWIAREKRKARHG